MEKYVWSLDISTTNIGFALWDLKGNLIELKHLELKINKDIPVEERDIHKADVFKNYIKEYRKHVEDNLKGEIDHIVVEAPLGGSNNMNTVSLLFGFNGISRYILYSVFNKIPEKITVYDSRKLFCPELVKVSYKYNRKTKTKEKNETLSFPKEYIKKKKLYIWEKVSELEPDIEWFYKKNKISEPRDICFDMSDAYAVGFAWFKKNEIL